MNPKIVLYADLDGTLLDENYAYTKAQPIINQLLSMGTAIVLNSSKTRVEIEFYRQNFRIKDPFIIENGSAILIPKDYFASNYKFDRQNGSYRVIELGTKYSLIREKIALVAEETQTSIVGFGDMTVEEIACETKLNLVMAALSKNREYDEALKIVGGNEKKFLHAIQKEGLSFTKGGKYYHILGNTNKGKATSILNRLYLQEYLRILSIGVGDSINDEPMFKSVDKAFMIDKNNSVQKVWADIVALIKTKSTFA